MIDRESRHQSQLTGPAKLRLTGVFLLTLLSLGLLIYRFTLPTDGWLAVEPDGFADSGFIYQQNVLGVDSDLQEGDWVTAVNNIPIDNSAFFTSAAVAAAWRVGNTLQYSVQRDGQTLSIAVPLVRWRVGDLLQTAVFPDLSTLFYFMGMVVFFAISGYAFWQRPDNPAAQALLDLAALLFSLIITLDILPESLPDLFNPPANFALSLIITSMFTVLLPPAFIRFGLVFPRPKPILHKRPWLAYLPYGVGTAVIVAFLNRAFVWGWVWTGTAVLITLLLLLHNAFTMRDAASRGQLRWALGGAILGMGLFSLNFVGVFSGESSVSQLGQLLTALSQLSFSIMGISLAVAVLRYSLFGIDRLVNRTLVYGGLTLCVVAIYVLVVGYLSYLFQTETNLTISLIATGLAAVLFDRLRQLLQRVVNRLMYGERDEPYQVLTRLGQQLENSLESAAALPLTVKTVAHALKLPYTAVFLKQTQSSHPLAAYGTPPPDLSRFPMVYGSETIGELVVGLRSPDEPLTPPDQRLLADLARNIAIMTHATQLSTDLEQARLRIVTERSEARRQLGSDLHDRVGHQLVGLTRQVEKVMTQLSPELAETKQSLEDVTEKIAAITNDVRHLAHQMFPPELELLGLVEALREHAQTRGGLQVLVDAPPVLPLLSTAVETAVYSITLEAITNVEKHAKAQTCWVWLALNDEGEMHQTAVLKLSVRDDGTGFLVHEDMGLGLLSMQARAIEVGGSCRFEVNGSGGTAVLVHIPINISAESE